VRFNDADRKRAWVLHDAALAAQDASLGRLLAALDESGRRDDTSVLVTGDVGVDTAVHVPFGDLEPLGETSLAVPLLYHPAAGATSSSSRVPTSSIDVATTVLGELGLAPLAVFEGEDLFDADGDDGTRPRFASNGDHALIAWMGLELRGGSGQSELCVPSIDAACASDAAPLEPLASEALRKLMSTSREHRPAVRTAPVLDAKTAAALTLWGR
jgi:hypothetical protein